MALLCMEHASVKYDRFNLDVSLTVEPGMITGLIGRNGSGKTTTFKAIVDVVRAGGKTEIFGKDNRRLTEEEYEKAENKGEEKGILLMKKVLKLSKEGMSIEDIVKLCETTEEKVKKILE